MFHYTVATSKSVSHTVEDLEANLKAIDFGVLWHLDLHGKLQEKGIDFPDQHRVLEVCNPKEAEQILNKNKLAGDFLPCKITVYEEAETTYISMPRPSVLMGLAEEPELTATAEDIERRLIQGIDQTV
ncbi:DUF302 domain-containing protein [Marinococcus halophilus]|uniref:DUF302 domain-containing protein n=1 Tax=Marinococcus halophilus TaxID=1371 RepID=A0A510Y2N7_MARHA|nr:DUF302 domain-containing protein [Marinococcus halophilus]OZT81614.1 DUF302 domain-containing protein [Marinococcus halophilus]GEK57559.1 hypothetical protein MHA01_04640 [Marinococcus halophilus]